MLQSWWLINVICIILSRLKPRKSTSALLWYICNVEAAILFLKNPVTICVTQQQRPMCKKKKKWSFSQSLTSRGQVRSLDFRPCETASLSLGMGSDLTNPSSNPQNTKSRGRFKYNNRVSKSKCTNYFWYHHQVLKHFQLSSNIQEFFYLSASFYFHAVVHWNSKIC